MSARKEGKKIMGMVGEGTSPDLLKNTPSNIRRLADEIEQCEGRHKYLAQTISSSDGGDVRWYFCKTPLAEDELAASVPGTEIVGKGDYFRFGMRDSLAIEASFLQREEELLSSWWKEYAECSEGPSPHTTTTSKSSKQSYSKTTRPPPPSRSSSQRHLYADEEERVGVPVKGGLYEVDLVKRHCFPVYWDGENRRVLRGHWFARKGGLDWLPLREDVAEQLEFAYRSRVWHRRTFQPSGLFAARVDLQGSSPGLHALFTGEDGTWEAWLIVGASAFSNVISLGGNGIKLRRGYAPSPSQKPTQDELRQQREEEMDDYCSQVPVQHLVFMVHGIGQRLEKSNLVDDVGNFRHITASLAERHLTSYQRGTQRVLFIPCQWRRGLKLSGEAAVDRITLDGVRGLRVMLSATVHDVLYYMSPIYCQDIIDSVSNQLNRLYMKFLKRNPGYDGKVSLYGHSLGSVLSYDILCHQETLSSPFPMEWMYKEHDRNDKSNDAHLSELGSDKRKTSSMEGDVEESSSSMNASTDAQETCVPVDPPSSSDSDELPPTININPNDDALLSEETRHGQSFDWSDLISFERKETHESPSITTGVDDDNDDGDDSGKKKLEDSDKDKTIKLLMKEIDLLKHKITDLESETGGKGYGKRTTTTTNDLVREQCTSQQSYTPYINYTKLLFKVDTYFAVGSPLGVFLALRNIRLGTGNGKDYWDGENINEEMPACRQMFNIFHPFDPVAYRIEPLICKEYLNKRPVIIPYHRGGKRLHVGFQEFTEALASHSHAFMGHISSIRVRVLTLCESRDKTVVDEGSERIEEKKETRSYGSVMLETLTGSEDGRIDHVLQDKTFRHPYISAIGAHTNYWRDYDTALFILKHLYRDIPEEPPSPPVEEQEASSKGSHSWYDHTHHDDDEELPLTFADKLSQNNFSRKAKRVIKPRQ